MGVGRYMGHIKRVSSMSAVWCTTWPLGSTPSGSRGRPQNQLHESGGVHDLDINYNHNQVQYIKGSAP